MSTLPIQAGDRTPLEKVGSKIRGFLKLNYARVIDLFRRLDTSGDGKVDLEEFRDGLRSLKLNLSDDEFEDLFNQFDGDKSGTLEIEELDSAIRILRRPQLKYSIERTVAPDGSTFGDMIPEMHGAKMEFLMTLENPSAQYRKDLYGEIGNEYITSARARIAKAARVEKLKLKRKAQNESNDSILPLERHVNYADRVRAVSIDTSTDSLFARTGKREEPSDRTLKKREKDWILDGNKSVSDAYCSALTEYQSLFDPTMKNFFFRRGRRKNVAETFYYEEVTREQKKSMAMAAHQVATYQNNASMLIFEERFRRVKDAGKVVKYLQQKDPKAAIYPEVPEGRRTSPWQVRGSPLTRAVPVLRVGVNMACRPTTPTPFGRLIYPSMVKSRPTSPVKSPGPPSPPYSLKEIASDSRYSRAFRRAVQRSVVGPQPRG
jgi:hypothetical protein